MAGCLVVIKLVAVAVAQQAQSAAVLQRLAVPGTPQRAALAAVAAAPMQAEQAAQAGVAAPLAAAAVVAVVALLLVAQAETAHAAKFVFMPGKSKQLTEGGISWLT